MPTKLMVWEQESRNSNTETCYFLPGRRVVVHNYIGYPPDTFFVSCDDVGVDKHLLKAKTVAEAKKEGVAFALATAEKMTAALRKIPTE